ncbi:hypothetical protein MMPV_002223 [Pyropia vietnamensis]
MVGLLLGWASVAPAVAAAAGAAAARGVQNLVSAGVGVAAELARARGGGGGGGLPPLMALLSREQVEGRVDGAGAGLGALRQKGKEWRVRGGRGQAATVGTGGAASDAPTAAGDLVAHGGTLVSNAAKHWWVVALAITAATAATADALALGRGSGGSGGGGGTQRLSPPTPSSTRSVASWRLICGAAAVAGGTLSPPAGRPAGAAGGGAPPPAATPTGGYRRPGGDAGPTRGRCPPAF